MCVCVCVDDEWGVCMDWPEMSFYKAVYYCVLSVGKLGRALNVQKCYLKCFLYSVCKDQEQLHIKYLPRLNATMWSVCLLW